MKYYRSILMYCCVAINLANFSVAQTWTSLYGPQISTNIKDISIVQSGDDAGNKLYTADNSYVLKSTTGGIGWFGTGETYSAPSFALVKPDDAAIVVVTKNGTLDYNNGGGASSWLNKIDDQYLIPLRLVADIVDPNVMLLGRKYDSHAKSIWRGVNGGSSWSEVSTFTNHTDINDFAPYPEPRTGYSGIIVACGSAPSGTNPQGQSKTSEAVNAGLWKSTDYGQTWGEFGFGNANLRSVAIIPSTTYIRLVVENVSGGNDIVWRDPGTAGNWTSVFSSAAEVRLVRTNIYNYDVYLATSNGIYRSTDEGANWGNPKTTGMGSDVDILSLAIYSDYDNESENDIIYAGTANTLYRSTNQGDNWENVGDMNASSVAFNGSNIWAVSRENAYAAKYNGSSWANYYMTTAGSSFTSEHILFRSTNSGGELWVSGKESSNAKLYRTTDGGATYTSKGPSSSGGAFYGTVKHPTQSNLLYLFGGTTSGTWNNFFSTTNDGTNWTGDNIASSTHSVYDLAVVVVSGTTKTYAALNNGTIYRKVGNESGFTLILAMTETNPSAKSIAINPNLSETVYVAGTTGLWRSTNGGENWSGRLRTDAIIRIIMDPRYPTDANHVWALSETDNKVYSTTNGGTNWSELSTTGVTGKINDIKSLNSGYVYLATENGVYTWDIEPAVPTLTSSAPHNNHPHLEWTANLEADVQNGGQYNVYRYFNRSCEYVGFNKIVCDDPEPTYLVASTTGTSFTDADFAVEFEPEWGFDRANYFVKAVDNADNVSAPSAVAFYYGMQNEQNKTVHRELPGETKPKFFALEANYPNPFNPSTQIKYALPEDVYVTVKVFDVLGKEVVTLVDGLQSSGFKSIDFDASNLTSGVYYYRLQAGKFVEMKKMLLLK